ncbi:MAG TPA: polysaccharide biosynthesis protein [Candidatus Limiplasma sp.]|nr:polysaccharide biosynthesis protein [Candidatus Limiplasma sp.]
MTSKQQSIIGGATVLGITGLICKIIAVLYRIPLSWMIGDQGIGTYQLVFPTYNLLLTISSAGLPVAISRIVSYNLAKGDVRNTKRTFKNALIILSAVGIIGTILMVVFRVFLSNRVGDPETVMGFMAIAPAVAIVCTMSAFRGFMQGQQNMRPTAISQLIEQIGKIVIALPLAYLGSKVGVTEAGEINLGYAAAGALLGTSIAEAFALAFMFLVYNRRKHDLDTYTQNEDIPEKSWKQITHSLFSLAIPITIGASIIPLASFVDSGMIVNRLMHGAGYAREAARAMYGRYSGYVITLINVPTALSIAISMSMVPAISANIARNDHAAVKRSTYAGLRMAFLIGLPCSFGMSVLAKPILYMVYKFSSAEALNQTAMLLSFSGFTIILFTVVQATSGILQGLQKQKIPMFTLMIGVCFKVLINYFLIATPQFNILGASIGSLVCYATSMFPNLYYVHKYTGLKWDPMHILIKPLIVSLLMAGALYLLMTILPEGRLITLALIIIGMVIYGALSFAFGTLKMEDIRPLLKRLKH